MKISLVATLSFLLLLSSTKLLSAHSDDDETVLDIYNNTVSSDLAYIIKIANTASSVLSYHDGWPDPCPFNVVQRPYLANASLTNFFPIDGSTTAKVNTNLVVRFQSVNPYCGTTALSLWKVNTTDASAIQWPVVVGEFLETDPETNFQIQYVTTSGGISVYKFVYRPSETDSHNLRLSWENGAYRLFGQRSRFVGASQFVFIPAGTPTIKLVTSN